MKCIGTVVLKDLNLWVFLAKIPKAACQAMQIFEDKRPNSGGETQFKGQFIAVS